MGEIFDRLQATLGLDWATVNKLWRVFSAADADGSGSLDIDELRALLKQVGIKATEKEFARITKAVDADNSGTVDFEEFVAAFSGASSVLGADLTDLVPDIENGDGGHEE